jgi:hypothetical protein
MPKNNIVLRDFIQYLKEISGDKNEFQINEFEGLMKPLILECKFILQNVFRAFKKSNL